MFLARVGFSLALCTAAGWLRFPPWSPPHPSCQPPTDIVFARNHSFNCLHDHSTSFSVKKAGSTSARRKTTEEDLGPVSERRLNKLVSEFPVPEQLFFWLVQSTVSQFTPSYHRCKKLTVMDPRYDDSPWQLGGSRILSHTWIGNTSAYIWWVWTYFQEKG